MNFRSIVIRVGTVVMSAIAPLAASRLASRRMFISTSISISPRPAVQSCRLRAQARRYHLRVERHRLVLSPVGRWLPALGRPQ